MPPAPHVFRDLAKLVALRFNALCRGLAVSGVARGLFLSEKLRVSRRGGLQRRILLKRRQILRRPVGVGFGYHRFRDPCRVDRKFLCGGRGQWQSCRNSDAEEMVLQVTDHLLSSSLRIDGEHLAEFFGEGVAFPFQAARLCVDNGRLRHVRRPHDTASDDDHANDPSLLREALNVCKTHSYTIICRCFISVGLYQ